MNLTQTQNPARRFAGEACTGFEERLRMTQISSTVPAPSTFGALHDMTRLACYLRDTLHLPDAALLAALHDFNDRSPAPLSTWYVDSLADATTGGA